MLYCMRPGVERYARAGIGVCLLIAGMFPATLSYAQSEGTTALAKMWRHAVLYDNPGDGLIRKFALSGRLQADAAWIDADEGDYDDTLWRRFRAGFTMEVAGDWVARLEGDFDLNESHSDWYNRLTDASIAWNPGDALDLRFLKHSAGFTLDGATSSKKLLTPERNNLTNNLWFTQEYFTGVSAMGELDGPWSYRVGVFSSDPDDEIGASQASYFTLTSAGYDFADRLDIERGQVRLDYVYNDKDDKANTRDFSHVACLVSHWEEGGWGLWSDVCAGRGYFGQSDIWGVVLMPFYNHSELLQWVVRYSYLSSQDDNGLRLNRYENEVVSGRGDAYHEIFGGLNLFFYGHKLKWQTGLQYTSMNDAANDGGEYDGWGLTTGLRISW